MIAVYDAKSTDIGSIFKRKAESLDYAEKAAARIIERVKAEGDKALTELTEEFDKVRITSIKVSEAEIEEAYNSADRYFLETLEAAKANIGEFHRAQLRQGFEIKRVNGAILGQRVLPLERVGLYIPGGTASYPSTVLMNAIPAKIAGVKEVIMASPPSKDGKINPDVLAAAKIAGVDAVYRIGGAQAIAALAYGTESVPKVDKITGPGNIFVAAAKKLVFGEVSIDMIAGPSEVLIIADETANAAYIAADMLSQAEHDINAAAILITVYPDMAEKVKAELEKQLALLPRESVARTSIENNGKIVIAESLEQAVEIANIAAPEHLELCVNNPFGLLDKVNNAGSVFLGGDTPEAVGDYFAGANHTLPTNGTARFSSALSVDDFVKKIQYIYYPKSVLDKEGERIAYFAEKEGLSAHARSVTIRTESKL
ncbi:MAG: histidinol dehydrogenase [Clostridiales bacterium]|jgi:histidinol dehydrogenase|nr:histidinol dehydrogenase [Clostridiales bacterium]HOB64656.1 histidinol dehydrogenase [Clostridia bacterium]HOK82361.1 histidinol dehydrogenase [Clostridia bacterium]HOL61481.1 histidinol dehydrogenase [Clostridia bacterium]HPO54105.1 histidinol dehydrogenase [Clostridia bacterium]